MDSEKLHHIISIIGEERIEKVYEVTKGEKISFAALYKQILIERIKKRIDSGKQFRVIAKEFRISRMTVYRIFQQYVRKSHK
ncbi:MAG TPA: helix-turn-helix domain-containing protein [Bacteroidia bacterium]|nr:helix-turn-helix domain-containing protein [Bacteroidia bacterium]